MNALRAATNAFWVAVLGAVILFFFFTVTGALEPSEVGWLTGVVAVLAVIAIVHFAHVRHALAKSGDNELARKVHAMREHRGF